MLSAYHRLRRRNFRVACLRPRPDANLVLPRRIGRTLHSSAVLMSLVVMGGRLKAVASITTVNRVAHRTNIIFRISNTRSINGVLVGLRRVGVSLVDFSNRGTCNPGNVNTLFIDHGPHVHLGTRRRNNNRRHNVHSKALPARRVINLNTTFTLTGRHCRRSRTRTTGLHRGL